ncbi:MAG: hypothetical protein ACPGNV_13560 [Mangrovicoccus sp.]
MDIVQRLACLHYEYLRKFEDDPLDLDWRELSLEEQSIWVSAMRGMLAQLNASDLQQVIDLRITDAEEAGRDLAVERKRLAALQNGIATPNHQSGFRN